MAQIKIYGLRTHLDTCKQQLSDVIHGCAMDALQLPPEKRFHRFIALEADDFVFPDDRSDLYTVIEISMFEGRSVEAKKHLLYLLMDRLHTQLNLPTHDIEITIFETPRHNWGIRGATGDELGLNYKVDV